MKDSHAVICIGDATVTLNLAARVFKTGSTGFNANGKLVATDGVKYQINVNAVRIGSKPR